MKLLDISKQRSTILMEWILWKFYNHFRLCGICFFFFNTSMVSIVVSYAARFWDIMQGFPQRSDFPHTNHIPLTKISQSQLPFHFQECFGTKFTLLALSSQRSLDWSCHGRCQKWTQWRWPVNTDDFSFRPGKNTTHTIVAI